MTAYAAESTGTVTQLLARVRSGDSIARDALFDHVQMDLRRVAQSMIRNGAWGRSGIHGTELVNMACARLLGRGDLCAEDRKQFFMLFGRAMHDVLVEEARRDQAARRGGGRKQLALVDFVVEGETFTVSILDLRDALPRLRAADPEGARVVELRFFAGQTLEQAAAVMGCTLATVRDHWAYARAWLRECLSDER